jgi:hypothetical protein
MVVMIASAAGAVVAAPSPWMARYYKHLRGDREAATKGSHREDSPATKILLLPLRSATLPDRSKKPAKNKT